MTQIHEMNLEERFFTQVQRGVKRIEFRLRDEKRRKLKVGDKIRFTSESKYAPITVTVSDLILASSFVELLSKLPPHLINTVSLTDLENIYSLDEQLKYGVVGIITERENGL